MTGPGDPLERLVAGLDARTSEPDQPRTLRM